MPPPQTNQPLPPGHVIDGYRFERHLSVGGFPIVYLANDPDLRPTYTPGYAAPEQYGNLGHMGDQGPWTADDFTRILNTTHTRLHSKDSP